MSNNKGVDLSHQHLRCLEGCSTYRKYWHLRNAFVDGKCPFCGEIDEEIYPILYKNSHWYILDNTLTTKRRCVATLLIVPHEHGEGLDWASMYAMMSFYGVLHWIIGHYSADIAKHGAMIYGRLGDAEHNIDTIPDHFRFNLIIPDGSGEVSVSVLWSEERQKTNRSRAEGFSIRYEAGEVPK